MKKQRISISFLLMFLLFIISFLIHKKNVEYDRAINKARETTIATEEIEEDSSWIEEAQKNIGIASWYDYDLRTKDQKCRSDDCYSMLNATCASRDYERGTILMVANLKTGDFVYCRVNDYGPEIETGVIIDLSSYAFKQLAKLSDGLIDVVIIEQK
jgi:rare lipoprotein A (peptidoglycan hydrolase)